MIEKASVSKLTERLLKSIHLEEIENVLENAITYGYAPEKEEDRKEIALLEKHLQELKLNQLKPKTLDGSQIENVYTLSSWYDQNSVVVVANNRQYRMHSSEILRILHEGQFTVRKARTRKLEYLEFDKIMQTTG